jgi:hypothetical protein
VPTIKNYELGRKVYVVGLVLYPAGWPSWIRSSCRPAVDAYQPEQA